MLGVPEFQVEVGNLCSGFEGMGLIFGFLCVYLWLRRDVLRFPHALIVLPIAVAASWLANIVRIVALIAVGAWIDPALAIGAFHSQAGWVSFLFLAIGFVVIVERFGLFGKEARIAQDVEYPASLFLLPMTVQLVLTLIFSTISSDFDLYYPVRTLIVLAVLYSYRAEMKAQRIFDAPALPALWLGILVYIVWVALIPQAHADRLALPSQLAAIWLLFRLFGSVVVVPIVEELAFRGYLLRRLQNRWFYKVPIGSVSVVSLAVSSIMFGFMHSAVLAGTLAGLAYAYATTLRGRLGDAIFAHAVTNLCIAVHVVALGRWDLWL